MPRNRQSGFTLIELMVTVSVLAILLSIAIPSFAEIMRSNQVAAYTNNLIAALNLARSEASKQGMPVTVCAASDATQEACGAVGDWTKGWIVFRDASGTPGTIDAGVNGDVILQKSIELPAQMQLNTDVTFARFNASGARMNVPGGGTPEMNFDVRHTICTGRNLRRVQINSIGRVTMTKVDCP